MVCVAVLSVLGSAVTIAFTVAVSVSIGICTVVVATDGGSVVIELAVGVEVVNVEFSSVVSFPSAGGACVCDTRVYGNSKQQLKDICCMTLCKFLAAWHTVISLSSYICTRYLLHSQQRLFVHLVLFGGQAKQEFLPVRYGLSPTTLPLKSDNPNRQYHIV